MTDAESSGSLDEVVTERIGRAFPALAKTNASEVPSDSIATSCSSVSNTQSVNSENIASSVQLPSSAREGSQTSEVQCDSTPREYSAVGSCQAADEAPLPQTPHTTGARCCESDPVACDVEHVCSQIEQDESQQELDAKHNSLEDLVHKTVQMMTAKFERLCQRHRETEQDVLEIRRALTSNQEDWQAAVQELRKEMTLITAAVPSGPQYEHGRADARFCEINHSSALDLSDSLLAPAAPIGSTETLSPSDARVQRLEDKVASLSTTCAERADIEDIQKKLKTMEHVDAKQVHDRLQALQSLVESLVTDFKTEVERAGEPQQSPFSAIIARSPGTVFPERDSGTHTPAFASHKEHTDAHASKTPVAPAKDGSAQRVLSAPLRASVEALQKAHSMHGSSQRVNSARGTSGVRMVANKAAPEQSSDVARQPIRAIQASGRVGRGPSPLPTCSTVGRLPTGPRGAGVLGGGARAGVHSIQRVASPSPPHYGVSFVPDTRVAVQRTLASPTRRCGSMKQAVPHSNAVNVVVASGAHQRSISPPLVRPMPEKQWSVHRPAPPAPPAALTATENAY